MAYVIAIVVVIVGAVLGMIAMTMIYHFFSSIIMVLVSLMLVIGAIIGLYNAIKNTIVTARKVYGRKKV